MTNLDAADHALRRRAEMQIVVQRRPGIRRLFLWQLKAVGDADSGYFQYAADIFDVTGNGCFESILKGADLFFWPTPWPEYPSFSRPRRRPRGRVWRHAPLPVIRRKSL